MREIATEFDVAPSSIQWPILKRFLVTALPLIVLTTLGLYFIYNLEVRNEFEKIEQNQLILTIPHQININNTLKGAVSDITLITEGKALQTIWDSDSYETTR